MWFLEICRCARSNWWEDFVNGAPQDGLQPGWDNGNQEDGSVCSGLRLSRMDPPTVRIFGIFGFCLALIVGPAAAA